MTTREVRRAGSLALLALLPCTALAAGGHGGTPTFSDIIPYWVNFLLYVGLLFVLLKGPVYRGWVSRNAGLDAAVSKGRAALDAAETSLRESQIRYARIDEEIAAVRASIKRDGDLEAEQIIADARARAERIMRQGTASADAERKALEGQLRRELADSVMRIAEEKIRAKMSPEADVSLRRAAADGIQGLVH